MNALHNYTKTKFNKVNVFTSTADKSCLDQVPLLEDFRLAHKIQEKPQIYL